MVFHHVITSMGNYAASIGRPCSVVKRLETMHFQQSTCGKQQEEPFQLEELSLSLSPPTPPTPLSVKMEVQC